MKIGLSDTPPHVVEAMEKLHPKAAFPRNPERDEKGNAVLYPGMPRFEGVAGLFTLPEGEVVIMAPTFEALDAHVRRMGVTEELSRERCIITEGKRLPNAKILP